MRRETIAFAAFVLIVIALVWMAQQPWANVPIR